MSTTWKACLPFLKKDDGRGAIETVWHMAANSDIQAGGRDPDLDFRLTFLTTHNVLKMMQVLNIPQLVFASSSAIYGDHDGVLRRGHRTVAACVQLRGDETGFGREHHGGGGAVFEARLDLPVSQCHWQSRHAWCDI